MWRNYRNFETTISTIWEIPASAKDLDLFLKIKAQYWKKKKKKKGGETDGQIDR